MTASPWDTRAGLLSPPPGRQVEEGQAVRGQRLQSYGPQSQALLAALRVLKTASRSPVLRKAGSYPASHSKNFALESRGGCQSCSHTRLHPAVLLSGLILLSVAWGTSLGLIQSSHTLSASDVPPGSVPARGTSRLEAAAWAVGRQDLRRPRLERHTPRRRTRTPLWYI